MVNKGKSEEEQIGIEVKKRPSQEFSGREKEVRQTLRPG